MTVNEILTPIINEEFQKYQNNGYKIKLRCVRKKRITYTVCCALGALLAWPVALTVYIILMCNLNNVKAILAQAKSRPDVPVDVIIAGEMIK